MISAVISLCKIIPNKSVLEALNNVWTRYQEDLHPRFKIEFGLESANFILKNNALTLDFKFCLQIKKTAMRIIFTPTFASLTFRYHEINDYSIIH